MPGKVRLIPANTNEPSNVIVDENGTHRNSTKYSSKNNNRILT